MSNFRIGQKVVCIDDTPACDGLTCLVRKGEIYTINDAWQNIHGPAVRLCEVDIREGYVGFRANRFRPVVERKSDISIFTDILKTSKQKVPA